VDSHGSRRTPAHARRNIPVHLLGETQNAWHTQPYGMMDNVVVDDYQFPQH
jgi:hypothetical protein